MFLSGVRSWSTILAFAPFLAVPTFFLVLYLRRAVWRQSKRQGRSNPGFSPATFTLGIALQHLDRFTHPSVEYVIQETYDEDIDEGAQGDPDDPKVQIRRQLRPVRMGEPVDGLILRLR